MPLTYLFLFFFLIFIIIIYLLYSLCIKKGKKSIWKIILVVLLSRLLLRHLPWLYNQFLITYAPWLLSDPFDPLHVEIFNMIKNFFKMISDIIWFIIDNWPKD
jgi:hypothetical protein